jgi:GAF domain-containing protein
LISEDGKHYDILALGGEKGSTRVGQNEPLEGSSVGLAVKENRLVVVNKSEDSGITGIFAFMVAPLIASGRVIGTLNIGSKTTNTFGPREERLVLQIASLLATTIESRRLLAQTRQRAEELAVVNRIARTISEALELDQMLESVLEEISRVLPVDAFMVGIYDQDKNLLEYPLVYDSGERYQIGLDTPSPKSLTYEVLHTLNPVFTLRTPEEVEAKFKQGSGLVGDKSKVSASLMYVPLFLGKRSTGMVSIQSYEYNAYRPEDLTLLESIANHVAVALENARLFRETEQRAEELSVVNRVAQVVSQMLELDDLYSAVHEQIQRAIVSDAFYIAIYNREDETINFPYLVDEGERYIIDPIPATSDLEVVQVITTGEPILENYVDQETAEQQFSGEVLLATKKAPTSMIFVPLRSGLEPVGAISIQNYQSHRYTQADVDLLSGIAYHLAVALENARLFSETERRAEELAVINKIAQAVSGQIEQQELLSTVYDQIRRVMPVDAFTVTAFNAETEMLHYLMVVDEGKQFEQKPTALGVGAVSRVIKEGQPILINRTQEELDELAQKQGVVLIGNVQRFSASLIFVPLQIGVETIGGLSVQSYELNAYGQPEIELLIGIANHVAVALENVRLFEETQNTLAETELLYNMGTHINRAVTLQDLVAVVGVPGIAPGAQSAGLFRFELDEEGQPEWMELEASWIGAGESVLPIGSRLHMPEIPLTAAELYTPNEPLLIENIATDDRVDTSAKALLRGLNTKAVAIIPMQQLDSWIGTLIIRWGEPYPFGLREQRVYNSLARQMSTALSNQLLLTETQDRATQLEKLTQIETALSQADDEEGIVESLALLAVDSQMLSLHYIVEEDKPKTAFTAARWVSDGNNGDEASLYEPFDIGLYAGFNLGLKNPDKISYVSDIKSDERITKSAVKEAKKTDYRAIMVIPLRSVGRWLGFVTVTWSEAHKFSAAEVAIWEQLREPLAANVASRRAYLAQQEALSETAVLYETGAQLSTASSYDEVLTVIRKNTVLGQGITNVNIMLFEHEWRQGKTPAYMDVLTFWSQVDLEQANLRFHIDHYPSAKGILEKASLSPLVFTDVPNSTEIDEKMKLMLVNDFKTKTFVIFPLSIRGEWIGVVAANYAKETNLSQREIRRIEAIVQQAGIAIQGLRNLEQAEQQAREARNRSNELVVLNEMGRSLTALVDMDSILENVYRYTARLMDANNFYIAFFDMKRNEISFALDIRGDRVMRNAGTRKAGKGLTEHIIDTKEPLLIADNVDDKLDELGIEKIGPSAASWLGVPLMVGSQVIGVIGLQQWETPRTYNEQHLHLLTSVAAQAAIAIENARLFEQIQARARRERILREVTAKVRGAADADSVMRTAVQEIGRALGRRTFVYLNQNQPQELESTKEEAYGD